MRLDTIVGLAFEGFRAFMPALVANASAMVFGGGMPVDLGRKLTDGEPLFGKNRTYRGLAGGLILGTLAGALLGQGVLGALVSAGALLGHLAGAFVKRRLRMKPGGLLPIADQYDFIMGALVVLLVARTGVEIPSILLVLILTPIIHAFSNTFSYLTKLRHVPW